MAPCDAMAEIRRLQAELERHKRAVEWMRKAFSVQPSEVPAEFGDIIKSAAGGDGT